MRRYLDWASRQVFAARERPAPCTGQWAQLLYAGEIVRMDAGGTVACLGKADGAQVGQILAVYHATPRHRRMVDHLQIDHAPTIISRILRSRMARRK